MDHKANHGFGAPVRLLCRFYLTAKHWQLILLLVVVPITAFIATAPVPPGPGSMEPIMPAPTPAFVLANLSVILVVLGWLWCIGSTFRNTLDQQVRPGIRLFQVTLLFPALYFPLGIAMISSEPGPAYVAMLIPPHLFAMFCMVYNIRYVARSLVLTERGAVESFYDYAGPFFLLWFYPAIAPTSAGRSA